MLLAGLGIIRTVRGPHVADAGLGTAIGSPCGARQRVLFAGGFPNGPVWVVAMLVADRGLRRSPRPQNTCLLRFF